MMKCQLLQFGMICCFSLTAYASDEINIVSDNSKLKWLDMPSSAGKYAVIAGNPDKEEMFVVRVKFPANYAIAPHFHQHYEYDTVISGSCYITSGADTKKANATLVKAGSFVAISPNIIHRGWAGKNGAVIQLSGIGPWHPKYNQK
jgi:quercetin dioxygenase-like cupin family protein